jgi:2-polyprenyl-3-methyl-5-hydroxy-6-metoxy-1,4-benzoquinol methylase
VFYLFLDVFILRQWYVKQALRKNICKKSKKLLYDAGAGFCQYSDFVLNISRETQAFTVDLKEDFLIDYFRSLSKSKQKRFSFLSHDISKYVLIEKKADYILAIDILEHIEDDMFVLVNFFESMNTGGLLIITTPNDYDASDDFVDEHVRAGYDMHTLISKVKASGFSIVECKYIYGFWGKLSWQIVMKNSLKMLNVSKYLVFVVFIYLMIILIPSLLFMFFVFLFEKDTGSGIMLIAKK